MKLLRIAAAPVVAGVLLAACSGGTTSTFPTGTGTTTTTATTATTATTVPTSTTTTTAPPSAELVITAPAGAANSGFAEKTLSAPADTPLTIVFKNDDPGIPHNVQIFEGTSTAGTPVFAPEGNALVNGVAEVTYEVPALAAGTYTYNCFAHPATMVGTLTVA